MTPYADYERLVPLVKLSATPMRSREPLLDVGGGGAADLGGIGALGGQPFHYE